MHSPKWVSELTLFTWAYLVVFILGANQFTNETHIKIRGEQLGYCLVMLSSELENKKIIAINEIAQRIKS